LSVASSLSKRIAEAIMTRFFAAILTTIAVGILLVAYGLISRPASAYDARSFDPYAPYAMTRVGADGSMLMPAGVSPSGGYVAYVVPVNAAGQPVGAPGYSNVVGFNPYAVPTAVQATAPVTAAPRPAPARRANSRDWRKTALVIGGSSAAGAGIGGLIGGKKGALIGAAIGGGASTLYESTKKQ
jgi:hypothetical protein